MVYKFINLMLILSVTTAIAKIAFSVMKIVRHRLHSRMEEEWFSDCLIPYIEKEIFDRIPNETILQYYQNMKTRKK